MWRQTHIYRASGRPHSLPLDSQGVTRGCSTVGFIKDQKFNATKQATQMPPLPPACPGAGACRILASPQADENKVLCVNQIILLLMDYNVTSHIESSEGINQWRAYYSILHPSQVWKCVLKFLFKQKMAVSLNLCELSNLRFTVCQKT